MPDLIESQEQEPVESPGPEMDTDSALTKVQALLKGEGKPEPEAPEKVPDEPPPAEKWDIKSVAERLGSDPEKLYALEISLPDKGGKITLGALKDAYRTSTELDKSRADWMQEKASHDADRLRDERELQSLLSVLPRGAFTQEAIALARGAREDLLSRAREAELRAIPEWADTAVKAGDRKVMAAELQEYGLGPADLDAVLDPRWSRALKALVDLKVKAREVKAVKPTAKVAQAPVARKTQSPAQEFGRLKASVTSKRVSPVDAVATLLRGN